jgi:ornithine cyclodeaminase
VKINACFAVARALGKFVYDEVARCGQLHVVDDFFHELRRHG